MNAYDVMILMLRSNFKYTDSFSDIQYGEYATVPSREIHLYGVVFYFGVMGELTTHKIKKEKY